MMTVGLALVIGAPSGIGLEIARCFAHDGHALIISGDDGPQLEEAAQDLRGEGARRVETVVADLAEPAGAARLYHAVNRDHATPDFLVINAGCGVCGNLARATNLDAELDLIQLNVVSVVQLTKCFVNDMIARGSGRILITPPIAGVAPAPKLHVYSATKAFAFAFAEALADDLKNTGVTVTALLPAEPEGAARERAGVAGAALGLSDRSDTSEMAQAGYRAMMNGADHVVAPSAAKMRAALAGLLPESMIAAMARPE